MSEEENTSPTPCRKTPIIWEVENILSLAHYDCLIIPKHSKLVQVDWPADHLMDSVQPNVPAHWLGTSTKELTSDCSSCVYFSFCRDENQFLNPSDWIGCECGLLFIKPFFIFMKTPSFPFLKLEITVPGTKSLTQTSSFLMLDGTAPMASLATVIAFW